VSKRRRIIIGLGASVVVCGLYLWFFGTQTFCAIEARWTGRRVPIVDSVPVDLADLSISSKPGDTLSFHGVEFEVPWSDIDESKTRVVGNRLDVVFRSDKSLLICLTGPGFSNL
jgi:hypothetical protein